MAAKNPLIHSSKIAVLEAHAKIRRLCPNLWKFQSIESTVSTALGSSRIEFFLRLSTAWA
jgi:hypothetical protein